MIEQLWFLSIEDLYLNLLLYASEILANRRNRNNGVNTNPMHFTETPCSQTEESASTRHSSALTTHPVSSCSSPVKRKGISEVDVTREEVTVQMSNLNKARKG